MALTLKKRWQNFRQRVTLKKAVAAVALILLLALIGFCGGVYLRIFDMNEINQQYGLHELPIVGQYFVVPPTGEPEEAAEEQNLPTLEKSKPVVLSPKELEKQRKERQAAEKKRISKLARLYNELKPQTAAEIMSILEDDVAIAILQKMDESAASKVLGKMDSARAASLTKTMYLGRASNMSSAGDIPLEQLQAAENAANAARGR